jgi:hypothetical protein
LLAYIAGFVAVLAIAMIWWWHMGQDDRLP